MDDSGVADAFYTVLSIGIVLVAALAISGVVLSAALPHEDALATEGMKPGLYSFYYAVDGPRSDPSSGDADDIVLRGLASEGVDRAIALNASTVPPAAPDAGAVIWSGFLCAPDDGDYELELSSRGPAWIWVDGGLAAYNGLSNTGFTLRLSRGYHAFKAKYYYAELRRASCALSWRQGGRLVPVGPFYR